MHLLKQALVVSLIAMVSACATPTTKRPTYSKAELASEQQAQAEVAKVKGEFNDQKSYSGEEVQKMATRLNEVATPIEKASATLCRDIMAQKCASKVVLKPDEKGLNAHADGKNVVIYPAMIDFAKNDNQLAFVIAHEFAHNILNHQKSLMQNVAAGGILGSLIDIAAGTQGVNTQGAFGKLGAKQGQLSYSPEFEHEADYVGLYILARAGFDYTQAPAFWRTMSQANPKAIYTTTTHPTNPSRTIQMNKTVEEINYKKAHKLALVPNFQPK